MSVQGGVPASYIKIKKYKKYFYFLVAKRKKHAIICTGKGDKRPIMRKTDIIKYQNYIRHCEREQLKRELDSIRGKSGARIEFLMDNARKRCDKRISEALSEFERILEADDLRNVEISTSWSKNRTWGMNPTSEGYVNARHVGTGHASGCGYDKHSAAANAALKDSLVIKKALIDKAMRECYDAKSKFFHDLPYGVDAYGKVTLGFGGTGMSTLSRIMEWLGLERIEERSTKTTDYVYYERKGE